MRTKIKYPVATRAKNPITCSQCGVVDQTRMDDWGNWIIGTDAKMICPDCGTSASSGHATLCRNHCPTEHGTTWAKHDLAEGAING